MRSSVLISIVTYNSRDYIEACLESVFAQQHQSVEVVVVDNGSADGTPEMLARYGGRVRVILNPRNLGFAAAQNQAIAAGAGEWVLVLNPDVVLDPAFLTELLDHSDLGPKIGALCGRLLSAGRALELTVPRRIDTTGIYFTPALRHLDRGWREPDDGRFREVDYVFGASAAAALYRREMIDAISDSGEFFDPDFFSYREDADVAWRAQLLGWSCLYVPRAIGRHVRSVGPDNRRSVPNAINMHSVKNRFLMRIKNMTPGLYRRLWAPVTMRDLLVAGSCLLWEHSSLPAFWHTARCLPRALCRRRWIMSRRTASDESLAQWFTLKPDTGPARSPGQPAVVYRR